MEQLLHREQGLAFFCSDTFDGSMLLPILRNLTAKAAQEWDDYDELYHCTHLIEAARRDPSLHMDFHTMRRDSQVAGIGLMTHGAIRQPLFFPPHLLPQEPQVGLLVFNYFHIAPDARGVGRHWLRDIILPHYRAQGYRAVYVKSSHQQAFSLYHSLGEPIGSYTSKSDNGLYTRSGLMFRIPL